MALKKAITLQDRQGEVQWETGIYKASTKSSSGTLPAAAHPHTVDGFKGLRATSLLSPAKQRQRGDRVDFHIKGMEAMEKEEWFQLKGCICTRRSKQAVNVFKLEIRSFLTAFQHGIGLCDSYLVSRQSQIHLQRVTLTDHGQSVIQDTKIPSFMPLWVCGISLTEDVLRQPHCIFLMGGRRTLWVISPLLN